MNYRKYNDYELIYMVRENDENSYDILMDKYLPIIKNISYHYYNCYSNYGYDLDDFLQEGYCAFFSALNHFDEGKDTLFYTFLVVCLHRSFISFCKKITNEKKNINNSLLVSLEDLDVVDDACDTEDYFIYRSNVKDIWNIIYKKPIEYISVFELRWNHFTFIEISKLLDISVNKIRNIYKNCIRSIQRELNYY
jgi:RNA polymerase sigma factor (sigma-70 family)